MTAATVVLLIGGAVAWATVEDDGPSAAGPSSGGEHHGPRHGLGRGPRHDAPARAPTPADRTAIDPYEQRYAAATPEERAAADALLADVQATLADYADVDDAVAAGYQARRRSTGRLRHYLHRGLVDDGRVLDPA
ncbi:MAG TPA: hypothetical protein VIL36_08690, partial [Acidimicrobiales bacterium]